MGRRTDDFAAHCCAGKATTSISSSGVNITRSRAINPKLLKAQESAIAVSAEKTRMNPMNG